MKKIKQKLSDFPDIWQEIFPFLESERPCSKDLNMTRENVPACIPKDQGSVPQRSLQSPDSTGKGNKKYHVNE